MKAVTVKAKGNAGYQDPQTGLYISSVQESTVPLTPWLENFINHNKIELIDTVSEDWNSYIEDVRANGGNFTEATKVQNEKGETEEILVAASPAEADKKAEDDKDEPRTRVARQPRQTPAPAVKADEIQKD